MAFTPNIPASGQSLGNSRTQVLNNFAILRSSFAVDHVDVNDSGNGKHKFCHLISQTSTNPTTTSTENVVFTRLAANSSERLFFRKPGNGQVVQLSNTDTIVANPGASFLMGNVTDGGVMIQWGNSATVSGTKSITFPHAFRNTSDSPVAPWSVQATVSQDGGVSKPVITVSSISGTGFTVNVNPSGAWNFDWMAIGPRT